MNKIDKIASSLLFGMLCMLTIFLLFDRHLRIPFWLQPIGRMHPLLLHFPIGFMVVLVVLYLFKGHLERSSYQKISRLLLQLTALSTAATAIMGLFLSREGYSSDMMALHKWTGAALAYTVYAMTAAGSRAYPYWLYCGLLMVVAAGHFGAGLTHGSNFLIEPIQKHFAPAADENIPLFAAVIHPILEAKCLSCHNEQKHKGQLSLSTLETIHKGGKHGSIWVAGDAAASEMIKRALLPENHDEHMPPKGKAQLTYSEIEILKKWIDHGADHRATLADIPESDSLHILATGIISTRSKPKAKHYYFAFADQALIEKLNNPYTTVTQRSPRSPAIEASIFGRSAFKTEYLQELEQVGQQIVSLNLSYLPLQNEALAVLAKMPNLEELNLNFTNIGSEALPYLKGCENLRSLSLSGTDINTDIAEKLPDLPKLTAVYLWQTKFSRDDLKQLEKTLPGVHIDLGYMMTEGEELRLNAPLLTNSKTLVSKHDKIELQHKLKGVAIRYTTDGSEPDSTSAIYTEALTLDNHTQLRTRAFKSGWKPSNVQLFEFFVKGLVPKRTTLLKQPAKRYKGRGALTLTDYIKGSPANVASTAWLGYRKDAFTALTDFGSSPPKVSKMVLSYAVNMNQYIMAPTAVDLWAGSSKGNMRLLKKETLKQAAQYEPNSIRVLTIEVPASSHRFYKVVAHPLRKLPDWHAGKGDKGWVFVDELFFY